MQTMAQESPCKDRLVVAAIDFGTTYSGYAFSFRDDYQKDPLKIQLNQQWNSGSVVSEKTPTCLLLDPDKKFLAFGYEAENEYSQLIEDSEDDDRMYENYYYFRRFKMSLHQHSGGLTRETMIVDETGKKLSAMLVISLSIGYMKDHLMSLINRRCIGIDEDDIHWIITIPAIWEDSAKQFMREAAVNYGIKSDQLSFALEPEAASLYCHLVKVVLADEETPADNSTKRQGVVLDDEHIPQSIGLKRKELRRSKLGEKCMILDLGGGTADITVHERQMNDSLREIHEPSWGPWGGTAVDREFFTFLGNVFGEKAIENFKKNCMTDFVEFCRDWEMKKRTIGVNTTGKVVLKLHTTFKESVEENSNVSFEQALSNSKYSEKVAWTKGRLKIDAEVMKGFFEAPIQEIVNHVGNMLKKTGRINMIMMVGGFSDCELVDRAIHDNFSRIKILNPKDGVLAVLKGAVIFGHKPMAIASRVARYTYGYETWPKFNSEIDPEELKVEHDEEEYCRGVFQPFIHKGTEIKCNECITSTHRPISDDQNDMAIHIYISQERDPKYITDPDVRHLGTLQLPLPEFKPGLPRKVLGRFHFGATEVIIEAEDIETGTLHKATFDCL
ncbi:heat shock 70 kDa protein 12B-like isoform X1 [Argopecten irradians]|uniref:heat shock 70 kDa protein 12B-like isoform X1 n=2 Tax=Argopecten irradians TaxID=31199 RepID=UPI00371AC15C